MGIKNFAKNIKIIFFFAAHNENYGKQSHEIMGAVLSRMF
jgi:hypothetical protein